MKSALYKIGCTTVVLASTLVLSGCNVDEIVGANLGEYNGLTNDGRSCKVDIRVLAVPFSPCAIASIGISVKKNDTSDSESKYEISGKSWCGSTMVAKYRITRGSRENPEQLTINNEIVIDIAQQKPTAVWFLEDQRNCLKLQKEVKK